MKEEQIMKNITRKLRFTVTLAGLLFAVSCTDNNRNRPTG